ncbi:MAG: PEP/pyruvate-binding domain-containing protein [bacterium]
MDYREHLLYQLIFREGVRLKDILATFEKVVEEQGIATVKELQDRARNDPPESYFADPWNTMVRSEHVYAAHLMRAAFEAFEDHQILDYINLAHKEELARRIWSELHTENPDFRRVEQLLEEFYQLPLGLSQISPNIAIGIRVYLISALISDNLFFIGVAKNYINMRDVHRLLQHFVGRHGSNSRIGGKAAGVILANRILRPTIGEPQGFDEDVAEIESFFVTSQVFNAFIEHNRLEEAHGLKYLDPEEIEKRQERIHTQIMNGSFPEEIEDRIREMLRRLSDGPIIVRSSSLLEDSMGFPFYGKYDSVFIVNEGPFEERCRELMNAIKRVFLGIFGSSVIQYRKDKNLLDYKDMMCVLVQRVVGSRYGKYFFPAAAGVAMSQNMYRWNKRIRREDGFMRLVMGLGTRAVERSGDDYTRIVALSHPSLRPEATLADQTRYSQRYVDVLNLATKEVETIHFVDLVNYIRREASGSIDLSQVVSVVEAEELRNPVTFPGRLDYGSAVITFDGEIQAGRLPELMHRVLKTLEGAYGTAVEVEFAYEGSRLYVLQCRPLNEASYAMHKVSIPEFRQSDVVFETTRDVVRSAVIEDVRYIVYVDTAAYHALSHASDKVHVARIIGRINRSLVGRRFILIGPGRWGSNSMDLGVKVSYGDINNAAMLIEVAENRSGYTPEVSYGTHFFQDLMEADIIPLPLYPDGEDSVLRKEFLHEGVNALREMVPAAALEELPAAEEVVRVVDVAATVPDRRIDVFLDAQSSRAVAAVRSARGG